ncbi:MAG TPA: inositol-3-phosphate synthase [Candidatus Coatesbacteria bacterium]|nr:inositol-3-phosphate synthase [Candidatus Coatesbacteria bacterium]
MPGEIRVAIVGVGNCASSLVQGVWYYREAEDDTQVPGLMHVNLGGHHVRDIRFVAAFDVNADKVGRDLSEAIFAPPNNTFRFAEPPPSGTIVRQGHLLDGIGKYLRDVIPLASGQPVDVAAVLAESGAEILLNYLPVGSEQATRFYVGEALKAGVAVINCVPVFIATTEEWDRRFREKGLPLIGDDVKSQVGATIIHRILAKLFEDRGVSLKRTSQLNVGGNTDFLNMLERERLESKRISKTQSVTSNISRHPGDDNVHIGPSDYVPWLKDRKWAHIRLEGEAFGSVPLNLELKLEVWDSPNSAGVVIDAVRCAKLALDSGIGGILEGPSAYFMKSPPVQHPDDVARNMVEEFIARHAKRRRPVGQPKKADLPAK